METMTEAPYAIWLWPLQAALIATETIECLFEPGAAHRAAPIGLAASARVRGRESPDGVALSTDARATRHAVRIAAGSTGRALGRLAGGDILSSDEWAEIAESTVTVASALIGFRVTTLPRSARDRHVVVPGKRR